VTIKPQTKFWILVIAGISFGLFGVYNIVFSEYIANEELNLSNYDFPTSPTSKNYTRITYPNDPNTPINVAKFDFWANDMFAAEYPINYYISAIANQPDQITKLLVVDLVEGTDTSWVDHSNVDYFVEQANKTGHVIKLVKNTKTQIYEKWDSFTPQEEERKTFLILVFTEDVLHKINNPDVVLDIKSEQEKFQLLTNQVTFAQVKAQAKSNHVVEGLSWIIIAWIPLELAIQIRKREFSN